MSRSRLLGLFAALSMLAAACGEPAGPVEIPRQELPVDLARTPEPEPSGAARPVTLFFARDGRLFPVTRPVRGEGQELLAGALIELLVGPNAEERSHGIVSFVPPDSQLLESEVLDQVASVDLSQEFQKPARPEQVLLSVAQIVWTAVALPGVTAVRFAVDGVPVEVPVDGGRIVSRPVTSVDYASVAAPSS